jgi:hypothetical protein
MFVTSARCHETHIRPPGSLVLKHPGQDTISLPFCGAHLQTIFMRLLKQYSDNFVTVNASSGHTIALRGHETKKNWFRQFGYRHHYRKIELPIRLLFREPSSGTKYTIYQVHD